MENTRMSISSSGYALTVLYNVVERIKNLQIRCFNSKRLISQKRLEWIDIFRESVWKGIISQPRVWKKLISGKLVEGPYSKTKFTKKFVLQII